MNLFHWKGLHVDPSRLYWFNFCIMTDLIVILLLIYLIIDRNKNDNNPNNKKVD